MILQELFPLSVSIFFWQKKPEKGFPLQSGLGFSGIQCPLSNIFSSQIPFRFTQTAFGFIQTLFGFTQTAFGLAQIPFGFTQTAFGLAQTPFGSTQIPFGLAQTPFGSN